MEYGDRFVAEKLLDITSLPEYLMTLTTAKMVRVRESNKIIIIEPIEGNECKCPLLGVAVGSKLTVEKFLMMTREDKEIES